MPRCTTCKQVHRLRRRLWQKLFYRAIYQCAECKTRITESRRYTFRFSRNVRCLQCGAHRLRVLSRRDHIERMSRHPWNLLQGLLGGRLYFCAVCRLQFYDWRPLSREAVSRRSSMRAAHS